MAMPQSLRQLHTQNKGLINKGNMFSVAPELLVEAEGFNVRTYDETRVQEHIRRLADAYKAGGAGVPPIAVQVVDGVVVIRDGHCRYRGIMLAISEGAEIERVQVTEHRGDEADQACLILTSNDGLKLNTLERAEVYKRLVGYGQSEAEVAKRVGRTYQHVHTAIQMLDMPVELKAMVVREKISASHAFELFQEHGTKAVDVAKGALQTAEQEGKPQKITRKNTSSTPKRATQKVTKQIRSSITSLATRLRTSLESDSESENLSISLPREEALKLLEIHEAMNPVEPETEGGDEESVATTESQLEPVQQAIGM